MHPCRHELAKRCAIAANKFVSKKRSCAEGGGKAGQERQHKLGRLMARERLSTFARSETRNFSKSDSGPLTKCTNSGDTFPPAGARRRHRQRRRCPVHDHRQRRYRESRRVLSADGEEAYPRATDRFRIRAAHRFTWSIPPACFFRCRMKFFRMKTISAASFRNNSVISAAGIPQFAAIMGNCVAGGAYLPVLCDKILMTEGQRPRISPGPLLVKAAIGQIVDAGRTGRRKNACGNQRHGRFLRKGRCILSETLRSLVALLPGSEREREDAARGNETGQSDPRYDLRSDQLSTARKITMRAICSPRSSMQSRSMNTRPITARRLSPLTRASAGARSGIVANQRLQGSHQDGRNSDGRRHLFR